MARMLPNGKAKDAAHIRLPHAVLDSEEWGGLTAHEVKLLLDLYRHCKGYNNGDLSMPWSELQRRGWKSSKTADKAKQGLIDKGFIIKTHQGGKGLCSLYAVTLQPIDDCRDKGGRSKFDPGITSTAAAANNWRRKPA